MDDLIVFKEEVKSRIDIVDVVSEFMELKKGSPNYQGLCPFHKDTAPSFSVNRERQFFYCFGCHKGGDVISFLREITGMSFMEALEQLADRAGLKMPKKHAANPALREQADLIIAANIAAAEYFHRTLFEPEGKDGLEYLRGRELTEDTIREFRLGYAPKDPEGLVNFIRGKNIHPGSLEAAGILKSSSYGGTPYNRFGGRVIFPIIDQAARFIGFGARLLEGEGAKYINSPDSVVYHKSRVLYGLYQAREHIKQTRTATVVEGYMDVLSLHQAGILTVIASSGTAFTPDQGRIITRMARSVTLLFDGDSAGITAASRGADNLLATDLKIGVAVLPEGHDPDSYVRKHGPDALQEYLGRAMDIWEFKVNVRGKAVTGAEDRIALAGEIADSISLIPDELKREVYIKEMSVKISVDNDVMRNAVNGRIRRRRFRREEEPPATGENMKIERESGLLAALIQYPGFARTVMEEVGVNIFSDPAMRTIAEELFHRIVEGLDTSPSGLMSGAANRDLQDIIAHAAIVRLDEQTAKAHVNGNLRHFKIKELRDERADISRRLTSESDPEVIASLRKRNTEIIQLLREMETS